TVQELVGGVEIVNVPGRAGDFAGAPVSGARAARELGWEPQTPFREGVRRYVEWHREELAPRPQAAAGERRRAAFVPLLRRVALVHPLFGIAAAIVAVSAALLASESPPLRALRATGDG